ncbi:MAG: hypothetical protein HYU59_05085 [Magnetospirillum gryphiswaldense]|nr:hypothetical protein [Magnetospirillum gryphiswaldense]
MGSMTPYIPMMMQAASSVAGQIQNSNAAAAHQQSQANQLDLQNQMLVQQQEQQAKQQRDLLKRQMATARASLGAGIGGGAGGSAAALLSGLTRQTEQDIADGASTATTRQKQIYNGYRQDGGDDRLTSGLGAASQAFSVLQPLFGGNRGS